MSDADEISGPAKSRYRPTAVDVPDPSTPISLIRNVSLRYELRSDQGTEVRTALDNVSLDVHTGEFLVIVGRSGCGKTTILNLLAGLVDADEGSVEILGQAPEDARAHVAYMFARDALLPWRSARKNVEFALEVREQGLSRTERRERAQYFLELLGVGKSAKLYPWQLSHGMRQRVALARTWAISPSLLLMDEPFAALDAQTRADAQLRFLELWEQEQRTVVFVTHDLSEALLLADRIIVMSDGAVIDEITLDFKRPRVADSLIEDDEYRSIYRRLMHLLHPGGTK